MYHIPGRHYLPTVLRYLLWWGTNVKFGQWEGFYTLPSSYLDICLEQNKETYPRADSQIYISKYIPSVEYQSL